jgi:hypothetical protein
MIRGLRLLSGVGLLGTLTVPLLGGSIGGGATLALGSIPVPAGLPIEEFLAYWWVFPTSILFSLVALSSGVSGALFFSPFFLLVVGLAPAQAIGAGLLTEVFGMGNGLLNYVRQGVVDYATAKWLLLGAVPAIVLGAFATHAVPTTLLTLAFGIGLLALGAFLVSHDSPEDCVPGEGEGAFLERETPGAARRRSKPPTARRSPTTPAGDPPVSVSRPLAGSSPGSSAPGSRRSRPRS